MRRSTRLGLVTVVVLLVLLGAYTAFWFYAAGRIEDGLGQGAGALRTQNVETSWRAVRVGGFPFAFDVELSDARLRDHAGPPGFEARAPRLSGVARPWSLRTWRLTAPDGLSATAGPADKPRATLQAKAATGTVAIDGAGGASLWLGLKALAIKTAAPLAMREAEIWLSLPSHPPQTHTEPAFGVAVDLRELTLPVVPTVLHNPLEELALGATVRGAIVAAPPRQAAAAWRDAGGTLDLDRFTLHWGAMGMTGTGSLALDGQLQPIAAFSGAVEGYPELMRALVAAGRISATEARLAQLALAVLSRTGADGRPQISTSFRIQNGQMYLGPAKLGPAPRISWP